MLQFKLREIMELENGKGFKAVLVCEKYVKSSGSLLDLVSESTGKMTYYLYLKELGEGQSVGIPEEDKFYPIEHVCLKDTDTWIPSNPSMKVEEQQGNGVYEGMTFKKLILL